MTNELFTDPYSTIIFDRHGELLEASIAADEQWRFPLSDSVSYKFKTSLISFEDKRFYSHRGVDPLALARAIRLNITHGEIRSGASTLTMQVVRLARKNQARTLSEKLLEIVLALYLEIRFSKDEILSLYSAHAPFGGNIVGLEAASWRYFNVTPSKLSWGESALLAVLPNAPGLIHLGKNRKQLLKKRNFLLKKMLNSSTIDTLTYELAIAEEIPPRPFSLPQKAPHLLLSYKKGIFLDGKNSKEKSRLFSTLDGGIHENVGQILLRHHERLAANNILNGAVLVIDISTGEVVAYHGNVPSRKTKNYYVDIIQAPRSTGSILKPFLFSAMLENGVLLPHQKVKDIPFRVGGFSPENFDESYSGMVQASEALSRSLNVPTTWMLQQYGVEQFCSILRQIGLETITRSAKHYGLSLVLGGAEGTLWDITNGYVKMVQQCGDTLWSKTIVDKYDIGRELSNDNSEFPLSAGASWLTLQALTKVKRPIGEAGWKGFNSSQKIAWKTGTSYGFRDGWSVGVTKKYAVGVWVGNADGTGRPGLIGLETAAPILFDVFNSLEKSSWIDKVEYDLKSIAVCSESGYPTSIHCGESARDEYPRKTELQIGSCPFCETFYVDENGERVLQDCVENEKITARQQCVYPPIVEKFYRKRYPQYEVIPPLREDCLSGEEESVQNISIVYPHRNGEVYIPITLSGDRKGIIVRATHRDSKEILYWHLNDTYIGMTEETHQLEINPPKGKHVLRLFDGNGEEAIRRFTVL